MLLVHPCLEIIPSLRTTFCKSSLYPCSCSQSLSRHLNPCLQFEILFLHTSGQLSTNLLQRLHVAAEGDSNLMNHHHWLHGVVCVCSVAQSCPTLYTPWAVACQAPLSIEFSSKNTGVGCQFLLQGSSQPKD